MHRCRLLEVVEAVLTSELAGSAEATDARTVELCLGILANLYAWQGLPLLILAGGQGQVKDREDRGPGPAFGAFVHPHPNVTDNTWARLTSVLAMTKCAQVCCPFHLPIMQAETRPPSAAGRRTRRRRRRSHARRRGGRCFPAL